MPGRILVVDDVATNRIILKVKLSAAFYDVLQASGGEQALEKAREHSPDLILLDMAMPDMDGIEVCRRLKADPRTADIPVVMVTASCDTAARLAALSVGAEDFLSKPLDDTILLARLRSLFRARGTAAELELREGTTQALGFCEPPADALALAPPGRIALLAGCPRDAAAWHRALKNRLPNRIDITDPRSVLGPDLDRDRVDVFLIAETMHTEGDGLQLLSELRAREATRHAAIILAMRPDARQRAALALDMGASDLITLPLDPEETMLRLRTQLTRKRQADRLRSQLRDGLQLAVIDPLTELYNRRYGLSHLDRVHARAVDRGRHYALMVADLDCFKAVNDHYGHAAGDAVLCEVAQRLKTSLRGVDLLARIGGEEFMIVMPEIDISAATSAAERLCRSVEAGPITLPGGEILTQTISIGLAIGGGSLPPGNEDAGAESVLARADRALYAAKAAGRNRTRTDMLNRSAA